MQGGKGHRSHQSWASQLPRVVTGNFPAERYRGGEPNEKSTSKKGPKSPKVQRPQNHATLNTELLQVVEEPDGGNQLE